MHVFDPNQLKNYPPDPGVYLMKDEKGTILYIGKAKNLRVRLKQYFAPSGDKRAMIPLLTAQVSTIETVVTRTEKEALLLENTLIKKHQPKYNAILKDDKTYVSLMINTKHPWPRLQLIRYKGRPKEKGLYFGPYTSAFAARQVYDLLITLFPLRQCSDNELTQRTRPCLLYGIKRCIAPCTHKCTHEEYNTFVQGAIDFLKGKDKSIIKDLQTKMQQASDALEFEKAAAYHQTIQQIAHVTESKQAIVRPGAKNCDAFSLYRTQSEALIMQLIFREGRLVGSEHYPFYDIASTDEELLSSFLIQLYLKTPPPQEILLPFTLSPLVEEVLLELTKKTTHIFCPKKGDKRTLVTLATKNAKTTYEQERDKTELKEKLLLDLVETCKLTRFPKRIECFDTSNSSGTDLVASMVAFTDGVRDTKRTRTFKIKDIDTSDDYAAMHQVLTRRLSRAKDENDLPDLLIIDGGKGQLNIALNVLKELDIITTDVISLSKEKGRHDKGLCAEKVCIPSQKEPIALSPRSPLLFFIQQIRDAAHDKALTFHKTRRKKRVIKTALDALPGIGPTKRTRLLKHFGSLAAIQKALPEELAQVKGITQKDIQTLKSLP